MRYEEVAWRLRTNKHINRGIYSNLRFCINKVRFHNRYETLEHFITKALLSYILISKRNQGVVTELEFNNGRKVDVVQVMNSGNLAGYEIESEKNVKLNAPIDIIEIKLKNIPSSYLSAIQKLAKHIENYVV